MSPERAGRARLNRCLVLCLGALALLLAPASARAVVGGSEDAGPLSRASVMVLSSRGGICSGVVLAPDVVLTAGHCASGAGQYRVHYRGPGGEPVLAEPAEIAVHQGYVRGAERSRRRSVDLALIRLSEPLPARFGAATLSAAIPPAGTAITLGGYGIAREGDGRSSGTFRTAALTTIQPHGPGRILIWAKAIDGPAGACGGDSGGPIAGSGGAVVAITGWAGGGGKTRCGELTQGTLVGPQRHWIDSILSRWGRQAAWR
ncbi:S1 family peptidase [Enterovirga rhinocerotis]|uniref:Trypsin n=1 Tax=Enterovirga rhinocerotis TaxID=1339210 RepID=A0A4R7BWB0_9HYPH|nr:trypsin-like serine protease [Enterovirga rhinocerotis]TDR88955.1 trypsin [Enterovirga rhinocerotis]